MVVGHTRRQSWAEEVVHLSPPPHPSQESLLAQQGYRTCSAQEHLGHGHSVRPLDSNPVAVLEPRDGQTVDLCLGLVAGIQV